MIFYGGGYDYIVDLISIVFRGIITIKEKYIRINYNEIKDLFGIAAAGISVYVGGAGGEHPERGGAPEPDRCQNSCSGRFGEYPGRQP
jgi:hypothetical protein